MNLPLYTFLGLAAFYLVTSVLQHLSHRRQVKNLIRINDQCLATMDRIMESLDKVNEENRRLFRIVMGKDNDDLFEGYSEDGTE